MLPTLRLAIQGYSNQHQMSVESKVNAVETWLTDWHAKPSFGGPRSTGASITASPIGPWISSGSTVARAIDLRHRGTLRAPPWSRGSASLGCSALDPHAVDVSFDGGEREELAGSYSPCGRPNRSGPGVV